MTRNDFKVMPRRQFEVFQDIFLLLSLSLQSYDEGTAGRVFECVINIEKMSPLQLL